MLDNYVLTSLEFDVFKGDIVTDCIEVVSVSVSFPTASQIKICWRAKRWKSRLSGIINREKMDCSLGGKGSSFFYGLSLHLSSYRVITKIQKNCGFLIFRFTMLSLSAKRQFEEKSAKGRFQISNWIHRSKSTTELEFYYAIIHNWIIMPF